MQCQNFMHVLWCSYLPSQLKTQETGFCPVTFQLSSKIHKHVFNIYTVVSKFVPIIFVIWKLCFLPLVSPLAFTHFPLILYTNTDKIQGRIYAIAQIEVQKWWLVSGQQCCSLLALSVYNKGEIWKCAHKSGVCGVYVIYKIHFVSEKTRFSCICWSQVDHHLFSIPLYPFFREANNQEIWLPFLAPLLDSIISSSKYHLFE